MSFIKKFLRTLSVFIACALIFSCAAMFSSCGTRGNTAMTLTYEKNTTTLSSNIYSYYLSYTKTMMLMEYYYMQGYSEEQMLSLGDNPKLWSLQIAEEVTYGDLVKLQAESALKNLLAVAAYCKEHKLSLSKDDLNAVDTFINEVIKGAYSNSKSRFNSSLLRFSINDKIYKEIKQLEALLGVFRNSLFDAETGTKKITDEMIDTVYRQLCFRFKQIFLCNVPGTKDIDGNPEKYTEEELAEKKARIDALYERIINGEDFENFLSEFEEADQLMLTDGYTFSTESVSYPAEILKIINEMEIGDVCIAEGDNGWYLLKKYELLPADRSLDIDEFISSGGKTTKSWAETVSKKIKDYLVEKELEPYVAKVEMNRAETDLFSTETSALMFDCTYLWY